MRIELTEDERRSVLEERQSHPGACVRRRLWAIWLLHAGLKREQAAKILGIACSTVQRDVRACRSGGREALRTSGREYRPTGELAAHQDPLRQSLEQQPARTIAEACQRIAALRGYPKRKGLFSGCHGHGFAWPCFCGREATARSVWQLEQIAFPDSPHSTGENIRQKFSFSLASVDRRDHSSDWMRCALGRS